MVASCKYCKGSGKLTLLTSVVDCECLSAPNTDVDQSEGGPRFLPLHSDIEGAEFLGHLDQDDCEYDAYFTGHWIVAVWQSVSDASQTSYFKYELDYAKHTSSRGTWPTMVYEKFLKPRGL
jgi:hypothetical protein